MKQRAKANKLAGIILHFGFAIPLLLIPACDDPSHSSAGLGEFITEFGEYEIRGSQWSVKIVESDRSLHISRVFPHGSKTVMPGSWRARDGWFVLVEDDAHVWAHDGGDRLYLLHRDRDGTTTSLWDSGFPRPVPEAVAVRLPDSVKAGETRAR